MSEKNNWEKRLSDNSLMILVVILVVAMASVVSVVGMYWYYFSDQLVLIDPEPWGQFGDFFGGTLNPIFGFLSVMALLAALVIQGRELKISSQELRNSALALEAQNRAIAHQSFEQTFFSWVDNYREMLESIEFQYGDKEYRGRRALRQWFTVNLEYRNILRGTDEVRNSPRKDVLGNLSKSDLEEIVKTIPPESVSAAAMVYWERLYGNYEYHLDSLFRNLYRLILWIDSQDEKRIDAAQKWLYVSIIRGQLSWIEMAFLFYNGYTKRGEKFKRLAEKYALFDNLNFGSDSAILHLKDCPPPSVTRYADSAYDSCLARKNIGLPESSEEVLEIASATCDIESVD